MSTTGSIGKTRGDKPRGLKRLADTFTDDDGSVGNSASTLKAKKKNIKTANFLAGKEVVAFQDDDSSHEIRELRRRVEELVEENNRLRDERDSALELNSLLKNAKSLVRKLNRVHQNVCGGSSCSSSGTMSSESSPPCPILSLECAPANPTCTTGDMEILNVIPNPTLKESSNSHFKFSGSDSEVVELIKGSGTYVSVRALHIVKMAKNSSILTRQLMEAIFTQEAMLTCSVRGRIAKGNGKTEQAREALPQDGVDAIIKFVMSHAEAAAWPPTNSKDIIKTLGTKLSEMRASSRIK